VGYVVGIDVGPQTVKAALASEDGTPVASAGVLCPADGQAEQDPAAWERALAQVVHEVRATAGVRGADVTALGLACRVDGLVALAPDPATAGAYAEAYASYRPLRDAVPGEER